MLIFTDGLINFLENKILHQADLYLSISDNEILIHCFKQYLYHN